MKGQYSSINPMIENGFFEFYDLDNFKKVATGYYTKGIMTGNWTFTDYDGINRKVNYDLDLIYNEISTNDNHVDSIFFIVDEIPKFQGTNNLQEFANYIGENLIYPPMSLMYIIEDRVILQFVINTLGQVSNLEAINKVHKDLEREAIRVVSQSPDWTPGIQKGKAVRVMFTFPINFALE
jgi:hypothetical protein